MKTRYLFGMPFAEFNVMSQKVEVLVDTGFNGSLLLPKRVIEDLRLKRSRTLECIMADGNVRETEVYLAEINWLGRNVKVDILSGPSDIALIGMGLLSHSRTLLEPSKNILSIS